MKKQFTCCGITFVFGGPYSVQGSDEIYPHWFPRKEDLIRWHLFMRKDKIYAESFDESEILGPFKKVEQAVVAIKLKS